ncbi:MAG: hypothetical protein U0574_06575 [Phycisphaerales bacterium]
MRRSARPGFTIVELMVAVGVLVVIILAVARIFGTASVVAGTGEANANMQQTAAAIERIVRADVDRMTPRGYLAIQCIAVRNDINNTNVWPGAASFGGSATAPLLDPSRPATDIIRCDQLVYFTDGFQQTSRFVGSFLMGNGQFGGNPESTASRVYLGPAVQFPRLLNNASGQRPDPVGFDFTSTFLPPVPWANDGPPQPNLEISYWNSPPQGTPPKFFGTQPEARQWILARQSTLLGDDGGSKYYFNTDNSYGPNSAAALWVNPGAPSGSADEGPYQGFVATGGIGPDPWILNGRVDIAASNLDDVDRTVRAGAGGRQLAWLPSSGQPDAQRDRIRFMTFGAPVSGNSGASLVGLGGFPRAEKIAPSMGRLDEILSATVLTGNCSSFEVDWTWREGTGRREGAGGAVETAGIGPNTAVPLMGAAFAPGAGTVWFGLPDEAPGMYQGPAQFRGVTSLAGPQGTSPSSANDSSVILDTRIYNKGTGNWDIFSGAARIGPPLIPANIEGPGITRPLGTGMPVWVYTAVFGFNGRTPATPDVNGRMILRDDFTPWPSALRITMRLHDPKLNIASGRTFQFVVDLPPQTQE